MRDEQYGIPVPSAEQLQQRWEQSLAQFELWAEIWISNPQLAVQAGRRIEELLMPLEQVRLRYTDIA